MTDNTKNLKIRLDGEINVSVTPQGLPAETPQAAPAPVAPTPVPEPERPADPVIEPIAEPIADPVVAPTTNAAPAEDTDHTQEAPEVVEAQPEPEATDDGVLYDDEDDDGAYEDVAPEAVQVNPVPQAGGNMKTTGYFTTTRQATSGIDEYPVLTVACENNGVRTTIAAMRAQVEHSLGLDEGKFRPYINGRIAQDNRAPNVGDSVIWLEDSKDRASA